MIVSRGKIKYIDIKFDDLDEFTSNLDGFGMKCDEDYRVFGIGNNIRVRFYPQYKDIYINQIIRVFKCDNHNNNYLILIINEN